MQVFVITNIVKTVINKDVNAKNWLAYVDVTMGLYEMLV